MASVLLRARSVIIAPNTTILPVCVTPKIKSENNSTRITPMQYEMIFDCHIPITTVTAAVTKAPTATRMPLLLMKSKTSPTREKKQRSFNANLKIGKSTIPFQIDSSSSVNIIDETTFQRIKRTIQTLFCENQENSYSSLAVRRPYPWWDSLNAYLNKKKRITSAKIVVVKGATSCLLSGQTSIDLNFLTVKVNNIKTKSTFTKLASQEKVSPCLKPMVTKYDKVVHGVGKLTEVQVHLHINKEIKPVVQPTRRIPFAICKKVKANLFNYKKKSLNQRKDHRCG